MNIDFHWDNLYGYIDFITNSKKIAKLCLMQNYKYMADLTNNHLLPSATEEHIKICMAHTEFIIVHVWNIDIEHVISLIKKKRNELEGDFRDKVRPHIINLIRLNKLFIDNIKTYNINMENLKKEKIRPEFEELLLINF